MSLSGQQRSSIKPGLTVDIVLKQDQRTGKTTRGVVKELLTNSPTHPHGIKVRLQSGQVGRVKTIIHDTASGAAATSVRAAAATEQGGAGQGAESRKGAAE